MQPSGVLQDSSTVKPIYSGILPMSGSNDKSKLLLGQPEEEKETKNMIEGFLKNQQIYPTSTGGESDFPQTKPFTIEPIPSQPSEPDSKYVINGYEVVNYIGEGSFGKVYLCVDVSTGVRYALKVQDKQRIDEAQI